ncbi:cell division protein FtsX [Salisaeta longa]|uniref:cell division protein FtsX n=1 Tax=Salisaeta longa TaxID=503170 RepID=UPI0003B44D31|nr:permease-like cell division protein FtsX [Salisaeta longa]
MLYALREGLASFRRAKFAAFASTSAMTVALVLIGLFGLVGLEAQRLSAWMRQRVGVMEVFVEEDASQTQAYALHARLQTLTAIDSTTFVSQQEAQQIFQREFGEGSDIFADTPFLPASVRLYLKPAYVHPDSLGQLAGRVRIWQHVDDVVFNQPLLVKVQSNLRLVTTGIIVLGLIVVLAAIFLVANTIRLTIYARRLLIRTMKLVGATDAFIRRPFLVEGVLQGLIAGSIAAGIVGGCYRLLLTYLPQLAAAADPRTLWVLVGGVVTTGVVLGWLGSWIAVRRFIRTIHVH